MRVLGLWVLASCIALAIVGCNGPSSPTFDEQNTRPLAGDAFANLYSAEYYGLKADDLTDCLKIGDPRCPLRAPTAQERATIQAAISGLNCAGLQALAQQALDQGRLQVFDVDQDTWGDSHRPLDLMHIWAGTIRTNLLAETIAHEAGHLSNKVVSLDVSEQIARQAEVSCGTRR